MADAPGQRLVDPAVLKQRRRRRIRLILLLLMTVLVVLLGVDNGHDVPVEYLVGEGEVRLVWVIALAFLAGAVFERLYTFVRGWARRDND